MQTYDDKLKALKKQTWAERYKERATIAVIMTDVIFEPLYEKAHIGYVATAELIADWAMEFYEKHKTTNWEQVAENGLPSLVNPTDIVICWDDAITDFAQYKLSTYSN